ncbi:MAG: lytic transglycosylase domain-containing protein [Bacteroidetes bacterium]|nr:lytic transglycosylase domain-containing protein [Bacteroidota bacterium]
MTFTSKNTPPKFISYTSLTLMWLIAFCFTYYLFFIYVKPNTLKQSTNSAVFFSGKIKIPANLNFCGEDAKIKNPKQFKKFQKEFINQSLWENKINSLYAKAQRWFPVIEPILKKNNIPEDFKYIALVESKLSNAVSPMGAAGFWQLVPTTASNYNLIINSNIDQRYDVVASTEAACKHFLDAYKLFNNWTLTAAAYNTGIGGLQSILKNQGKVNFYTLKLNYETESFIYRILSYKTLIESPHYFGIKTKFKFKKNNLKLKKYILKEGAITLSNLAKELKCPKTILKLFNPWILNDEIIVPSAKTIIVYFPNDVKKDYSEYYDDLFINNNTYNELKDPIILPLQEQTDSSLNKTKTENVKDSLNVRLN